MSLISGFATEPATVRLKLEGGDGFGGSLFADPVNIKVRSERRMLRVITGAGVEFRPATYILTEHILNVGDEVTLVGMTEGAVIESVEDVKLADGALIGTEAYL